MSNVLHFEKSKPHVVVECGDGVHVLPVSLIEDVISGRRCLTEIEQWSDIIKVILKEYLEKCS